MRVNLNKIIIIFHFTFCLMDGGIKTLAGDVIQQQHTYPVSPTLGFDHKQQKKNCSKIFKHILGYTKMVISSSLGE